jgi:hypothetical protein
LRPKNGYGPGEVHHGGYAERARIKGNCLILLPEDIWAAQAVTPQAELPFGGDALPRPNHPADDVPDIIGHQQPANRILEASDGNED